MYSHQSEALKLIHIVIFTFHWYLFAFYMTNVSLSFLFNGVIYLSNTARKSIADPKFRLYSRLPDCEKKDHLRSGIRWILKGINELFETDEMKDKPNTARICPPIRNRKNYSSDKKASKKNRTTLFQKPKSCLRIEKMPEVNLGMP